MSKSRSAAPPVKFKDRLAAMQLLPRFFKLVWKTSPSLMLSNVLLRLLRSATPVSMLYIGKLIIDQIVLLSRTHTGPSTFLWQLVAAEFLVAIVSDAVGRLVSLLDSLLGDLFANRTSIEIMTHAATLDLEQFEDSLFYDKLERARQQTTGRTVLLAQVLGQVQDLITMGFLAVGLIAINPWLVILLLVAVIPAFLGESYFNDKGYVLTRGQTPQRRELDYIRFIGASDETAKEVKIFDLSGFIIDRFRALSNKVYDENKDLTIRRSIWGTVFALIGSAGYYVAYVVIILRTVSGNLTIGDLTFLAGSFRQVRSLLESILTRFSSVSQGAIYLRDFFDFFDIKPQIVLANTPRPFPMPIQTGFAFEDVGFRYANAEHFANRHLTFTLSPGEKLALVGENGAGKTTLVKLLARLYDPTEGRILLDGYDLREYDIAELRLQIGIIFQDFTHYQMSLAQNIAIGNISKKEERELIIHAAEQSLADSVAAKFATTYEQALGRRFNDGVDLSGGEWQKVALARAYMRDAQLLILDEPTAALDARAEYQVFQRFAELTSGKSAVLISHRFSTVRMADRILLLERGELKEIGSHDELLKLGGSYAELFSLQAQGYR